MFFIYSIKVALTLTAFYLTYKLLLSRETFFGFNRTILLVLTALALVLPVLPLPDLHPAATVPGTVIINEIITKGTTTGAHSASPGPTPIQVLIIVYIVGIILFTLLEAVSFLHLHKLMHSGTTTTGPDGVRLTIVNGNQAPFSWFRNIVINRNDYRENHREIITHELAHISHRHSVDILFIDLLIILQWYNPAAWLIKRELQCIHEYEADRAVLLSGVNPSHYQLLLIRKAAGEHLFAMANNLSHSSLKKRITMMLRKKSNRWSRIKILAALPVAALAAAVFAGSKAEALSRNITAETDRIVNTITNKAPAAPSKVHGNNTATTLTASAAGVTSTDTGISVTTSATTTPTESTTPPPAQQDNAPATPSDTIIPTSPAPVPVSTHKEPNAKSEAASNNHNTTHTSKLNFQNSYFLIDDKPATTDEVNKIKPSDIKSISVLKGKSATNVYGTAAKNGAIIIETKK